MVPGVFSIMIIATAGIIITEEPAIHQPNVLAHTGYI